jgi:Bacterial extracellular solute-binding proteins, family 5 Middle
MSATFKLRAGAKFHDGTPVTARGVEWSFDRAVPVGGFPTFQMKAGSLEKPEQPELGEIRPRRRVACHFPIVDGISPAIPRKRPGAVIAATS